MQKKKPIPVQIAFQGGGAKLPALIAVADALLKAESDEKIKITKLAGTSAGSIAACILATRPDFSDIKDFFKSDEAAIIAKNLSTPSKAKMVWSAFRGKPISSFKPLRLFLKKFFDEKSVVSVGDLKIDTKVTYTDLSNSDVRTCDKKDDINLAIESSCAIPIYFSTWKNSLGKVDGGVGENLPVKILVEEKEELESDDEILAVSFKKQGGKKVNGPKGFLLSIIDTAISSNESKSIDLLDRDAVHEITTTLDTFDFYNAFKNGFGDDYKTYFDKAESWIDKYIKSYNSAELIKTNYWRDENENLQTVMRSARKVYGNLIHNAKFTTSNVVLEVIAFSLRKKERNDKDKDMARLRFEFQVDSESLAAISIGFFETDPDSKFFPVAKYSIKDKEGNKVKTVAIPLLKGKKTNDRTLGIFFKTPLLQNTGPYSFTYEEEGYELLKQLKDTNVEPLFYKPYSKFQSKPISNVKLIVHYPSDLHVSIESAQEPIVGKLMSPGEFDSESKFPNFSTVGWYCDELDPCLKNGLYTKLMIK